VFFLLFGSSAAGKTSALEALQGTVARLALHDFDEIGVPAGADTRWRQRANEQWLQRALGYEREGVDLLLAGQTPLGEFLAAPSAPRVEAISACLLDCDDQTRTARMNARGGEWLARTGGRIEDFLNWAAWMRGHAADPQWRPDVIRQNGRDPQLDWDRWSDWQAGDPRWHVEVIDTSALPVQDVAERLAEWVEQERSLFAAGFHPLTSWAEIPAVD
jgi:chloramphenicol 3-O-phosphotransferase